MRIQVIASPPKMADSLLLGEVTSPQKRDSALKKIKILSRKLKMFETLIKNLNKLKREWHWSKSGYFMQVP